MTLCVFNSLEWVCVSFLSFILKVIFLRSLNKVLLALNLDLWEAENYVRSYVRERVRWGVAMTNFTTRCLYILHTAHYSFNEHSLCVFLPISNVPCSLLIPAWYPCSVCWWTEFGFKLFERNKDLCWHKNQFFCLFFKPLKLDHNFLLAI